MYDLLAQFLAIPQSSAGFSVNSNVTNAAIIVTVVVIATLIDLVYRILHTLYLTIFKKKG